MREHLLCKLPNPGKLTVLETEQPFEGGVLAFRLQELLLGCCLYIHDIKLSTWP